MPPWNLKKRCPLAGHLLLILVGDFAFGCAIELQDGVDTDLPDSLGEGGLLCADGEFALVFVAYHYIGPSTASKELEELIRRDAVGR